MRVVVGMLPALLLCAALAVGCGSDSGSCPNVQGAWKCTQHCTGSQVGVIFTLTQNGCTFTTTAPGVSFSGVLDGNGKLSTSGTIPGGRTMTCTGSVNGNEIVESCLEAGKEPCSITLQKL